MKSDLVTISVSTINEKYQTLIFIYRILNIPLAGFHYYHSSLAGEETETKKIVKHLAQNHTANM